MSPTDVVTGGPDFNATTRFGLGDAKGEEFIPDFFAAQALPAAARIVRRSPRASAHLGRAENYRFAILQSMQTEHTYSLTIEHHEDGYLAFFPALPGCNTWAPTYEGAIKNAEEALSLYLETLTEHGDPIPEETTQAPISLGVTVRTAIIV